MYVISMEVNGGDINEIELKKDNNNVIVLHTDRKIQRKVKQRD